MRHGDEIAALAVGPSFSLAALWQRRLDRHEILAMDQRTRRREGEASRRIPLREAKRAAPAKEERARR
jgi:hypothetical protein